MRTGVESYAAGDVEKLEGIVDVSYNELQMAVANLDSLEDGVAKHYGRTLWCDERAIACFGVWPFSTSSGRAWSILTEESLAKPKLLYSSVLRTLERFEAEDGMIRIETIVRVGHPTAHSWIRHLGFQRETKAIGMRNYGIGGEDYHLYSRIPEGD